MISPISLSVTLVCQFSYVSPTRLLFVSTSKYVYLRVCVKQAETIH